MAWLSVFLGGKILAGWLDLGGYDGGLFWIILYFGVFMFRGFKFLIEALS